MKYIIKEIPNCEMKMIYQYIDNLKDLVKNLNLENNVDFVSYIPQPEIYFKNTSLHIFPTVREYFGYVLSETKIYGIPNIMLGLDYVSISKGGLLLFMMNLLKLLGRSQLKY